MAVDVVEPDSQRRRHDVVPDADGHEMVPSLAGPVDGAVPRTNWRGVAAVIAVYAVTLTLFASVKWLQFWDYFD